MNGKCRFKFARSFLIVRHQLAPLSLRESHGEAVIQPAAGLRRDAYCPVEQRLVEVHDGRRPHDPGQEQAGVTDRDELLAFRLRERTSDLAGKDGRSDQLVDDRPRKSVVAGGARTRLPANG
jgi:hypothetical protein